jgi:glucose/arabinose dehydrogenase
VNRPTATLAALPAALVAVLLAGCTVDDDRGATPDGTSGRATGDTAVTDLATGLDAPWSMIRLASGSALVSERDSGRILELTASGDRRAVGVVDDVVHEGEGGLLGLAVLTGDPTFLYAYETTADDNRVVRAELRGDAGSYSLGEQETVLDGLAKATNHDGGRIAFGPDGMLYATVGDASDPANAQDPDSLNGKILRMTPTGAVPGDNPRSGSLVWSMGHRNPQGLAWDADGRLWAAEFGQNTFDELNLIEPGKNYGWPEVEGKGGGSRFTDPVLTWTTDEASPSGLVSVGDRLYLAGLGGERLWVIDPGVDGDATAEARYVDTLGRIRDVAAGPDDTLWLLTNNTDGRGSPRSGDDRIVEVPLDGG